MQFLSERKRYEFINNNKIATIQNLIFIFLMKKNNKVIDEKKYPTKYVVDTLLSKIITSIESNNKNKILILFSFTKINKQEKKTAIEPIAK